MEKKHEFRKGEVYKVIYNKKLTFYGFDLYLAVGSDNKQSKSQFIIPFIRVVDEYVDRYNHCITFNNIRVDLILEAASWGYLKLEQFSETARIKKLEGPIAIIDLDSFTAQWKPYRLLQKCEVHNDDSIYESIICNVQTCLYSFTMPVIVEEQIIARELEQESEKENT